MLASSGGMRGFPALAWRNIVAAAVAVLLALGAVGHGLAAAPDGATTTIAGIVGPICHAGGDQARDGRGLPSRPDCCDDCALSAPVLLPQAPSLYVPVRTEAAAELDTPATPLPRSPRTRTPRQAQGPPIA